MEQKKPDTSQHINIIIQHIKTDKTILQLEISTMDALEGGIMTVKR